MQARDDGDRLSEAELISMAFLLLVAGHETTVNLIGNGVLALLRDPAQLAALRADPALLPSAIEEFLRLRGAGQHWRRCRFTTEPVSSAASTIPAGEIVLVSLLAANRDDGRFAEPDELDVTARSGAHLAFGHGIHYCLGAPLARLEGEIALRHCSLDASRTWSSPAERGTLRWRDSTLIRGLQTLPVRLGRVSEPFPSCFCSSHLASTGAGQAPNRVGCSWSGLKRFHRHFSTPNSARHARSQYTVDYRWPTRSRSRPTRRTRLSRLHHSGSQDRRVGHQEPHGDAQRRQQHDPVRPHHVGRSAQCGPSEMA